MKKRLHQIAQTGLKMGFKSGKVYQTNDIERLYGCTLWSRCPVPVFACRANCMRSEDLGYDETVGNVLST